MWLLIIVQVGVSSGDLQEEKKKLSNDKQNCWIVPGVLRQLK